ncbi:19684_t:CDS:2, partial [Racocetra fulgida]
MTKFDLLSIFNFGSKNKNNQDEQNVSRVENNRLCDQDFVKNIESKHDILVLSTSSTGNVSTHNKNNTRPKKQQLYASDKELRLSYEISDLRETIKAKDKEIEAKNKEIEAKNHEISGLRKDIEDLKDEASRHQSALGRATNFRLSDDDCNNSVQLREDITSLQQTLKDFCIVKPNININKKEAMNLLQRYGCTESIDGEHFKSLLKAALQRFVLETILDSTSKYFEKRLPETNNENTEENTEERSLETRIVFETKNLLDKMKHFAKFREGDDDVTRALPIKLRQQIYAVLGNRGFSKVISKDTVEHPFINETQEQLIKKINSIRTINDPNKITKLNSMAANIVRDVIRIFFFRLKVQEPEADSPHWFEYNDPVDPELMQGTFEHDCQDGFAFVHTHENEQLCTNETWPGEIGRLKTNTVLQYDDQFDHVEFWGYPALAKRPKRKKNPQYEFKPVELFKLHLGNLFEDMKPKLPVDYKKAITDYLREIGKLIKDTIITSWPSIEFHKNVLLVMTVPAEYSHRSRNIMRECVFNAGLTGEIDSEKLQFTTERGGTVDLTTRRLYNNNQLGEVTERAGDFCGSAWIDREFIKFLKRILGETPLNMLERSHYGQMQYMVQEFCKNVKFPFDGKDPNFSYDLDLGEENDWIIELDYMNVKNMFDPVVNRIINMIKIQLDNSNDKCSMLFLVGGFSQSKYLQSRIKEECQQRVNSISVPVQPIASICRGAAYYGLSMKNTANGVALNWDKFVVKTRVLKYTYGIKKSMKWKDGDPKNRKSYDGFIDKFHPLASKGSEVSVDQEFTFSCLPLKKDQVAITFEIFCTQEQEFKYCDELGMKLLGKLRIDLPDVHLGLKRPILFGLCFGKMEITAFAQNKTN